MNPSDLARAKEIAFKIWGDAPLDHEFGETATRAMARSQHNARVHATTELIAHALSAAREECGKDANTNVDMENEYKRGYKDGLEKAKVAFKMGRCHFPHGCVPKKEYEVAVKEGIARGLNVNEPYREGFNAAIQECVRVAEEEEKSRWTRSKGDSIRTLAELAAELKRRVK